MCRQVLILISAVTLTSCVGLDTRLPEITAPDLAAETARQETQAIRQMESEVMTLLNVGWPVITANAELCPRTRSAIGVKTHKLKSYPKRLRDAAGRVLGADETPRIFQVAKGSPAEQAGLQRNDIILDADGQPVEIEEDWETLLEEETLTVKRGEKTLSLPIKSVSACDYKLRLSGSNAINAYADGRNITLTSGMMDFVESENELALIIGHELGHNTMGHIRKSVTNYIVSLGGTRYTRPFESEADYVGLYYMVRAGYSPEEVEGFWQRLAKVSPRNITRAKTHPTFPDRFLRIAATRTEIFAKQQADLPLYPNFITGAAPSE